MRLKFNKLMFSNLTQSDIQLINYRMKLLLGNQTATYFALPTDQVQIH